MAHDKAGLTHSRIKQEADRCKLDLLTQRELLQGGITRFKKNIRNFHWLEENGLSVQKLLLEIGESYDKLCTELKQLVDEWSRYIRLTVISKEPQPQSSVDTVQGHVNFHQDKLEQEKKERKEEK